MDAGKARPSHSHRGMQAVERGKAEDERMEQYLPTDKELLREMRRVRRKNKRNSGKAEGYERSASDYVQ